LLELRDKGFFAKQGIIKRLRVLYMSYYAKIKTFVFLKIIFFLAIVWTSFAYFMSPQTSRLNPYYVQQRMIQEKLYLIDQNDRGKRFAELIDLLKHVDSFRRREILQGNEMKNWYRKLMFVEQAGIMEEILPQPLIRFIKKFLMQPEEDQIAYVYRAGEMLLASNKAPANIRQQLANYQAADFQEKRRMIREEIQKYPSHQRYYKILEILFYKLNGRAGYENLLEQAQVMVLESIMNEERQGTDS
jgi:hypothetical protein